MGSALRILGKGAWPASPMGVQTNRGPTQLTAGDGMVPLQRWWSIQHIDLSYFIKNICTFYALLKPNRYENNDCFLTSFIHSPCHSSHAPNSCIGWANLVMSNPLGTSNKNLAVLFVAASGLEITHCTFIIICYMSHLLIIWCSKLHDSDWPMVAFCGQMFLHNEPKMHSTL